MTMDRRDLLKATGLSLVASTALARQAFGQSRTSDSQKEMLDAALNRPVQRGDIPGVVAGITDKNQTTYFAAFGERALGKGIPMTTDSVFHIASMTKAITGTAAMQLVEQSSSSTSRSQSTSQGPRSSKFSRAWTIRESRACVLPSARLRSAIS